MKATSHCILIVYHFPSSLLELLQLACVFAHQEENRDPELVRIAEGVRRDSQSDFRLDDDGVLWFGARLCVPPVPSLREEVLSEAQCSTFSVHSGGTKMYRDLRDNFWWSDMKRDIAGFVAQYLTCQQVKSIRQKYAGLLQPLSIRNGSGNM